MKTTMRYVITLLMLPGLIGSCSDKDESPAPETRCKMTRFINESNDRFDAVYDAQGKLITYTYLDGSGTGQTLKTTLEYDSNERLSRVNSNIPAGPNGKPERYNTFIVDSKGNTTSITSFRRNSSGSYDNEGTTTYIYDGENRIVRESYGAEEYTRYEYDSRGNISKIFRKEGTLSREYLKEEYIGYDDKINLVRTNFILSLLLADDGYYQSQNNPLESKVYTNQNTSDRTEVYTYTYNEQGFPTQVIKTQKRAGTPDKTYIDTFQYECQ